MKTFYVYLVLLISLSGCVSTIVVHPNYKNTDYKGSSLLLRMTDDTLGLDYAGDLTNEFGSEGVNDSIKSFLTSELLKHLRDGSNYKEIAFCTGHDKLDMTKLAYRYRKDGVRIDSLEFFTPNTTLTIFYRCNHDTSKHFYKVVCKNQFHYYWIFTSTFKTLKIEGRLIKVRLLQVHLVCAL